MLVADLDGDGKLDLLDASNVYLNDGTGRFGSVIPIAPSNGRATAVGDFNGDGKLDLLCTTPTTTQVRLGNGNGTFGTQVVCNITIDGGYLLGDPATVADFSGDGKLDVAFGPTIYVGNGAGSFTSRTRFRMNSYTSDAAADMDGDGSSDLVVFNASSDDVDVLLTRTTADPTAVPVVTLTTDKVSGAYAETVKFIANVTGTPHPLSGVICFSIDGQNRIVPVDSTGKAEVSTSFTVGSHQIHATYTGDENYLPRTASKTWIVAKAIPEIDISAWPNPSTTKNTVSIRGTFPSQSGALPGPTGSITIREGATVLGTNWVNVSTFSVGSHVITLDYPGDANYEALTTSYTQEVTLPLPSVVVQLTPSTNIVVGQTVTLTATLYGTNVTGTVTFELNGIPIGTVPISGGIASMQTMFNWGSHDIVARYSGDLNWAPATGSASCKVYLAWESPLVMNVAMASNGWARVSWAEVLGATQYTVWKRTSAVSGWVQAVTLISGLNAISIAVPSNTTWMFAMTAKDANGNVSPMSAPRLATNVPLTDPEIIAGVTVMKAQHIIDLRAAVAAVRTFAGLGTYAYSRANVLNQFAAGVDITELRQALAQARAAIGFPVIAFTDPTLSAGSSTIRAAHILELRAGTN